MKKNLPAPSWFVSRLRLFHQFKLGAQFIAASELINFLSANGDQWAPIHVAQFEVYCDSRNMTWAAVVAGIHLLNVSNHLETTVSGQGILDEALSIINVKDDMIRMMQSWYSEDTASAA
jgi:hypothetical protein